MISTLSPLSESLKLRASGACGVNQLLGMNVRPRHANPRRVFPIALGTTAALPAGCAELRENSGCGKPSDAEQVLVGPARTSEGKHVRTRNLCALPAVNSRGRRLTFTPTKVAGQ